MDTLMAVVTLMTADAVFEVSATEVAVSETAEGLGALAGAWYVTDVIVAPLNVPQVLPLHPAPAKVQVTPLFCESFVNVAVNVAVPVPACTFALPGEMETETTGFVVVVMVAVPLFVPSAMDVAVRVTAAGLGTDAGAL